MTLLRIDISWKSCDIVVFCRLGPPFCTIRLTLNVTVVERYGHWKQNDYLYIHFLTVEAILGRSNQPQSMFIVSYLDLHQICIHDPITTGPDNMNVWQGVISRQGDAVRIPGCFHVSEGSMQSLHNVNLCHPSGSFPAHNDVRLNRYGTFRYIGMVSVTFADIDETIGEEMISLNLFCCRPSKHGWNHRRGDDLSQPVLLPTEQARQ